MGLSEVQGPSVWSGVYLRPAWPPAQDKLEVRVSGLIHSFLSPQRNPLYSS